MAWSNIIETHGLRAIEACECNMGHPPRIPVWLRSDRPVIYFVTICVANSKPVLANERTFHALRNTAEKMQDWRLIAAVLMPNHLHAIVAPKDREFRVGNFAAALKRWMRKELDATWTWQPGSFDRLLCSGDSLEAKSRYLQENPVRAGLVKHSEDWPYRIGFDQE
jgi:REP element-mobilizing transposase RayT